MPVLSAGRVLTIISITVLISLSFIAFTSNSPEHPSVHLRMTRRGIVVREPQPPVPSSPSPSPPTDGSGPPTVPTDDDEEPPPIVTEPTTTTTPPTTVTTPPPPPPPTTTTTTPRPSSTTPPPVTTTTTSPSSTSTSTSTSTSSSTSSSSSTTALSTATFTSSLSTLNLAPLPTTTSTGTPTIMTNIYGITDRATSVEIPGVTTTITPTSSSNSSGFLSNPGAVAATFTAVGLLGIGVVVGLWVFFQRRRRIDDQDIFEDQFRDYSPDNNGHRGHRGSEEHIVEEMDYATASPQLPSANVNAMFSGQQHCSRPADSWDMGNSYPNENSNRDSAVSNHAGYGAHGVTPMQQKPTLTNHSSPLAREQWTAEAEYSQPALTHAHPTLFVPPGRPSNSSVDSFYGAPSQPTGYVGAAY